MIKVLIEGKQQNEHFTIMKSFNMNPYIDRVEVKSSNPAMPKSTTNWVLSRKLISDVGIEKGPTLQKLIRAIKQFEQMNKGIRVYALTVAVQACLEGKNCKEGNCTGADCGAGRSETKLWKPTGYGINFVAAVSRSAKDVTPVKFSYSYGKGFDLKLKFFRGRKLPEQTEIKISLIKKSFNLIALLKDLRRGVYHSVRKQYKMDQPVAAPNTATPTTMAKARTWRRLAKAAPTKAPPEPSPQRPPKQ